MVDGKGCLSGPIPGATTSEKGKLSMVSLELELFSARKKDVSQGIVFQS